MAMPAAQALAHESSASALPRIASVDRLRGLALSLVVLDHTGRYLYANVPPVPPADPTVPAIAWFMTGWLSAAAVPVLVFLAGVGVRLRQSCGMPVADLSRSLVVRGLLLIVLELTVVRVLGWFTFGVEFIGVLELLWVLGASMLVLAVLVHLPLRDVVVFAAAVIALHNLLDGLVMPGAAGPGTTPGAMGKLWILLHQSGDVVHVIGTSGPVIAVVHPVSRWSA